METHIKPVKYAEWVKFQSCLPLAPRCNFAFLGGECYGLFENIDSSAICSMVWYAFAFRNSPWRLAAIPEIRGLAVKERNSFLNQNVRLLARVSTLPPFRGKGYAAKLIAETLPYLGVRYVECLTAHESVRRLLAKLNFIQKGGGGLPFIDYWLIDMAAAACRQRQKKQFS